MELFYGFGGATTIEQAKASQRQSLKYEDLIIAWEGCNFSETIHT
jgi:hypothetical protein